MPHYDSSLSRARRRCEAMAEMSEAVECPVIASGGVTTAEDVRRLAQIGVAGCIIGRSLYEGTLTLPEAIEAAKN